MGLQIGGFQKVTLLDFPKRVACIIFTIGCNYKCPFCHNSELVDKTVTDLFSEEEILNYLEKRKGIIDGISISGGEPTIQSGLIDFIKEVKNRNIEVKLDTNGSNPQILKTLFEQKLIDYIAMDIKNDINNYNKITGMKKINTNYIKESIDLIKESGIEYEFRTTIIKEYHNTENIKAILELIGKDANYYLQNFKDSENVPQKGLHSFNENELQLIKNQLINEFPNLKIRGIK